MLFISIQPANKVAAVHKIRNCIYFFTLVQKCPIRPATFPTVVTRDGIFYVTRFHQCCIANTFVYELCYVSIFPRYLDLKGKGCVVNESAAILIRLCNLARVLTLSRKRWQFSSSLSERLSCCTPV